jgi:hypothetical protein
MLGGITGVLARLRDFKGGEPKLGHESAFVKSLVEAGRGEELRNQLSAGSVWTR